MMKMTNIFVMALAILLSWNDCGWAGDQAKTISDYIQQEKFEGTVTAAFPGTEMLWAGKDFNDFPMFDEELFKQRHKSTGRAFLYSLILPGAGEFYTGSKIKAIFFLGIEAFSWYSYISNYGDGQDLEDQFRAYASEHWNPGDYRAWLVAEKGIPSDTFPFINDDGDLEYLTHTLPGFKTQQYYEMIGKYDQFLYGWDDTDYDKGDSVSLARESYLKMRDESNSKFDAAKNYAIVSIANRLVSAFDAALSARKLNKRTDRFSSEMRLKARLADYYGEKIPRLIFTYNFY